MSGALDVRLQTLLERAVDRRRRVRHGLLAVSRTDGSWSWEGAHGTGAVAGGPVTTRMRYPIASVTKLFTAVTVLRLVEQGRLALDERIVDVLPAEVTAGLHVIGEDDHTDRITVEHLLDHSSGLPDYYGEAPRGGRSAQDRLLAGEDAPVPFGEVLRIVREELTPHFPPQPFDAPKRRARYADTNYQLLAAVAEQRTRQALSELFDTMLFGPLGLDDTSSYPHPPRSGASAEPEVHVFARDVVLQPQGALRHQVADGGIVSTLADQVRFLTAVVEGAVFEDPATWPRMLQRRNRIFFPIEYGLGVMRYAPARWMSPTFAIPPIVGHTGSTATWSFHCPELDLVVAGTFDVAQPPLPFRFLPHVLRAVAGAGR
ncbi:serine hydrolase domain-containing protein [Egicoccus sp. AB-alg6-2]|uniref:serine hydrolase domain-containing protein n=1 Tax=Egicoccus sp. AB-alg6-2 TaxID=3242692 RepID=UPI00359DA111